MRKFKLSESETRLLLLFLAVLMFAGAYFLSFQRNVTRAEEMEAKNEEDQEFVQMLESMVAQQSLIEAQTEEYNQTIEDIIAKYPSDVPTAKAITIIQEIENRSGASVSSINFSMGNQVVDLSGDEAAEGTEGGTASTGVESMGYRDTIGMNYEATYTDFKNMISYINGLTDRTTIPSITAAYDSETDKITGVITIDMFYLTNTGKEYDAPNITGISKGVTDIFRSGNGTAAPRVETEVEESEEENEEENGEEQEQEDSE